MVRGVEVCGRSEVCVWGGVDVGGGSMSVLLYIVYRCSHMCIVCDTLCHCPRSPTATCVQLSTWRASSTWPGSLMATHSQSFVDHQISKPNL